MSETNAQTKTSDQGLLAAGFFVGLTPLYYAKVNSYGEAGLSIIVECAWSLHDAEPLDSAKVDHLVVSQTKRRSSIHRQVSHNLLI